MFANFTQSWGRRVLAVIGAVWLAGWAGAAAAVPIAPGFDDRSLAEFETTYATADLGFSARLGGVDYDQAYVHLNGVVTFGDPNLGYETQALPTPRETPLLAPFWVDVDLRMRDAVTFGQGTFDGDAAFAVVWRDLSPYYGGRTDRPENTFQLILVDRSSRAGPGAFDVFYLYEKLEFDVGAIARSRRARRDKVYATAGGHFGGGVGGDYFLLPGSNTADSMLDDGATALSRMRLAPVAEIRPNGTIQPVAPTANRQAVAAVSAPPALLMALSTFAFGGLAARVRRCRAKM